MTDRQRRKDLFWASPLNVVRLVGCAVGALLFPGLILGVRRAVWVTVGLLGLLVGAWLWELPWVPLQILYFWLVWSAILWVCWTVFVLVMGVVMYVRHGRYAAPDAGVEEAGIVAPWEKALHWVPTKVAEGEELAQTGYEGELVLEAPQRGLYVLEARWKDSAVGEIFWTGRKQACWQENEEVPGEYAVRRAVFRLEAGRHVLRLWVVSDVPPVECCVTQLNAVKG